MKDVSLGQYYPAESPVHRLDPRAKLLMVIAYVTMIFFINTFTGYGLTALFLLVVILFSGIPILSVLRSVKPVLYLIIFTFILSLFFYGGTAGDEIFVFYFIKIYREGLFTALKMAARLLLLVSGPSLLTLTTTPTELTDGLESLLKPLQKIGFPAHELAIIMSIALRLIPTIGEETEKIINAQKARCADFDSGNPVKKAKSLLPVLIPLFVSSFRRADELAYAIDSRCYRGAKGRTRMKKLTVRAGDFIAAFILAAFFFALLCLRYNYFGLAFVPKLI